MLESAGKCLALPARGLLSSYQVQGVASPAKLPLGPVLVMNALSLGFPIGKVETITSVLAVSHDYHEAG